MDRTMKRTKRENQLANSAITQIIDAILFILSCTFFFTIDFMSFRIDAERKEKNEQNMFILSWIDE